MTRTNNSCSCCCCCRFDVTTFRCCAAAGDEEDDDDNDAHGFELRKTLLMLSGMNPRFILCSIFDEEDRFLLLPSRRYRFFLLPDALSNHAVSVFFFFSFYYFFLSLRCYDTSLLAIIWVVGRKKASLYSSDSITIWYRSSFFAPRSSFIFLRSSFFFFNRNDCYDNSLLVIILVGTAEVQ